MGLHYKAKESIAISPLNKNGNQIALIRTSKVAAVIALRGPHTVVTDCKKIQYFGEVEFNSAGHDPCMGDVLTVDLIYSR